MLFLFINWLMSILPALSKISYNSKIINGQNISSGEKTQKLDTRKTLSSNESRPVSWQWLSANYCTKVRTPHRLKKWRRWIVKTRQSKHSFALAYSEVRNKPDVYFHKLAYITSHAVCRKDCISVVWFSQCSATTGAQTACGPPQHFQRSAVSFRKKRQIWNLLKSLWGYVCFIELLALDKVYLHKNNENYLFCVTLLFLFYLQYLFYDQIRRYGLPLTLRWGIWLNNLCAFSVTRRSLSWIVRLAQWTQWHQINLSFYPLNAALSKWLSSQINCPSLQQVVLITVEQAGA